MKIRDELLKEHSLENTKRICDFACLTIGNFQQLIDCFLEDEYRVAQRAAWVVSHAASKKPELISPYVPILVGQLARTDVHTAVVRNSLRILQQVEIPEVYHGEVMSTCFQLIENHCTPVAIKAFSLTVLTNLSNLYPEIVSELRILIEERWDIETPAVKSRAKKLLNRKS